MKKLTKGLVAGLCAVVGLSAVATVAMIPAQVETPAVQAETTYNTKDIAMMGRVAGWYDNGNFEIRLTLGYADWSGSSAQKNYVGEADLATALNKLGFFDKIKLGDKTLREWGCTACYDNWYKVNSGEPDYTLMIPLAMGAENIAAATAAGIGANTPFTILEGALIPSDAYLQGDTSATVYRAGCDFVTSLSDVPYGIMTIGKTEVESIKYVTGWDSTYSNAYLGVSLKGDDYEADGSTVERHPDYYSSVYTTNQFPNMILANGVGKKAESYGLFNLNSNGLGYYSFVWRMQQEECEEITIPAGTLFPSRAMRNLFEVNGNPVYIMYETQTDVTFVRTEDGTYVSEAELAGRYAETAIAEVENYKAGLFREAEEAQRLEIVAAAKAAISASTTTDAMATHVAKAKQSIDALKTAAQYADEELAATKAAANAEIEDYKADAVYFAEQESEKAAAIVAGKEAVAAATTEAEIAGAVAGAKAAIDAIQEKSEVVASAKATIEGYNAGVEYAENEANQKATIIAEAVAAIDAASTQTAVNSAVNSAKAAIDMLWTKAEAYVTTDVAFIARIAGWYGNGNFTLAVTLGASDWTKNDAGVKAYEGNLTTLLQKLGFFDHIMVGGKTLTEWGCTACYDDSYELNTGEPDNIMLFHLGMGADNMAAATAAGVAAGSPITILKGAIIPSYGYLTKSSNVVYHAGATFTTAASEKAYGIESVGQTTLDDMKYVQGHDGVCGYFGVSFVGDDYLGDGKQLEVAANYSYANSYAEKVLVNGEAGLVKSYGLFNLGENGKGYFAFQINVPEKEVISITIPAGTRFPSRAMADLKVVNNNPVYIMYEVAEDITLYNTVNGFVSYEEYVALYGEAKAAELEGYKAGAFREAEEAERLAIIEGAKAAIANATEVDAIDALVVDAMAAIDALKTAAQYADEELAAVKAEANAEIEGYLADVAYLDEQAAVKAEAIATGLAAVAAAVSEEEIQAAVVAAKAAMDAIETKAAIVAAAAADIDAYKADVVYFDEQAAEKAAIVEGAKAAVEAASSEAAIAEAVANAKAAIDEIKTKAELEEEALAGVKVEANATVDALKKAVDFDLYADDAVATINGLYANVKSAIENAKSEEEINAAVAAFEAALAEVPQKGAEEEENEGDAPSTDEVPSDKSLLDFGCFGTIGGLAYGMVMLGAAVVLFKKKEN